jgi:hypothetical protein
VRPLLVYLLAVSAAGCADSARRMASVVRTDSAGIGTVRLSPSALEAIPQWTLGEPTIMIGDQQTDGLTPLHLPGLPVLLESGNIVVPNEQTEIRYYSPDGRLAALAGRKGEGPGEYRRVLAVFPRPGDSLVVFDGFGPPYRVSLLSPVGRYLSAHNVEVGALTGAAPAMLNDGSLVLVVRSESAIRGRIESGQVGAASDTAVLVVVKPDGAVQRLSARTEGPVIVLGAGIWKDQRFAPAILMGAAQASIAFAQTDRFEFQVFSSEGRLKHIVSVSISPTSVTPEVVKRIDRTRFEDSKLRREDGNVTTPGDVASSLPIIDRLRIDRVERVWVRKWSFPDERTSTWIVFGPDGAPQATLTLPASFDFRDAGKDWILGRVENADGVPSIRRMPIRRAPTSD